MLSDSELRERLGPLGPLQDPDPPPRPVALFAALIVLLLLFWGGSIALILHLDGICPPVYDAPSGHIYYFCDHRPGNPHIVYHTANEHYTVYGALAASILTTLGVIIFALARKPTPSQSS